MDAKEYLANKAPDTVAIINTYCPTEIALDLLLESYHTQKSEEEAEVRHENAQNYLIKADNILDGGTIIKALRIASGVKGGKK